MKFDANKRGLFYVVRSQTYVNASETTQERRETWKAVIAVSFILAASVAFLVLYLLER